MISYDEALRQILESVSPLPPIDIQLSEASGLVLAAPAVSRWDMPRCDNSAMDGIAITESSEKFYGSFTIIGASFAGHPYPGEVKPGQAIRITTGAALPQGANSVVPIEDMDEKDGVAYLRTSPKPGQHVRCKGEEYRCGEILVETGTILRSGEIALLASAGIEDVKVFPRPRVAIISTGDELVELGQDPGPGQIINSNLHFLTSRLTECGCIPVCIGIGVDEPNALNKLIDQTEGADVVISTGGVSVGEKDHVLTTLKKRNFREVFWKVAIKPGKPVLFGMLGSKPYFGLPGNPAATAATFELFVKPSLKKLAGQSQVFPEKRKAILTSKVMGSSNRQMFLWCQLDWQEDHYEVSVATRQGSGQSRSLVKTNALLSVPMADHQLQIGQKVEVMLLN